MSFVTYKERIYKFFESSIFGKTIMTYIADKATEEFLKEDGFSFYYYPISIEDERIIDEYTEKIYFTYDDNGLFEGKDAQWDISTGGDRVERGFIKLGMMGYIPGWKIVNVLESEKMVNVRNFKDIYRVRKYTKKDGVMCEEPIIEKVPMTALELEPYLNSYYKV